jgi:PAS domain S-box-containing protein
MTTIDELKARADVPVLLADRHGLITYVNGRFEDVFGWSAAEILGKPLTTVIPKHLHDSHHLGFSRFLATGKPTLLNQSLTLKAVRKDGREFDSEHFIVAEKLDGHWVFGAILHPEA